MVVSRIPSSTRTKRADSLRIESEVGLTFSGIALDATDKETRTRMTEVARKAYETTLRLRYQVVLTDAENTKLDRNLLRLRGELQSLGQAFE